MIMSNSKLLLHGHAFKHYYIALLCTHILDHKTHEVWGSSKVQEDKLSIMMFQWSAQNTKVSMYTVCIIYI